MNIIKAYIDPGLSVLPSRMDSPEARAMLIAIALQESRFQHRLQIGGPARGFWQFEKGGGIRGVLNHHATKNLAEDICKELRFPVSVESCYQMVAYNDTLACAFARLLLWTLPGALPEVWDKDRGWDQYIEAWRPGKPHRHTWNEFYDRAWNMVVND